VRDGLSPVLLGQIVVLFALAGFTFGVIMRDIAVMGGAAGVITTMGALGAFRALARPETADTTEAP
jgi:hypothetical protein